MKDDYDTDRIYNLLSNKLKWAWLADNCCYLGLGLMLGFVGGYFFNEWDCWTAIVELWKQCPLSK